MQARCDGLLPGGAKVMGRMPGIHGAGFSQFRNCSNCNQSFVPKTVSHMQLCMHVLCVKLGNTKNFKHTYHMQDVIAIKIHLPCMQLWACCSSNVSCLPVYMSRCAKLSMLWFTFGKNLNLTLNW